ncbi:MAG: T9SS type A sorting domain-containing protein, partial [Bacteroidota bacterium]
EGVQKYQFLHPTPGAAQHFYRIRAYDLDGSFHLSPLVYLHAVADEIKAWPNPTTGSLNLSGLPANSLFVRLSDAYGKSFQLPVRAGQLNLADVPPGSYLLHVPMAQGLQLKVIKVEK